MNKTSKSDQSKPIQIRFPPCIISSEVPYLSNNTGVFQIKYLINDNEFLDVIELGEKIIRLNPRISYYKVKDPKKIIEKRPANVPYWEEHCAINFNNNSNITDIMNIIIQAYNIHR